MKKLLFLGSIWLSCLGVSQELESVYLDTSYSGHEVQLSSFNYYASNAFNNDLTNKFIYGGTVTSDIKDFNTNRLKRINAFGAEAEQRLTYYNFEVTPIKKWSQYGLIFTVEDNNFVSANMSSDLYKTVFYGNQNHLGDTMDFSFSHAQYLHFQKVGFGLVHKKYKSYLKVDFVLGNQLMNYRLGNTWMYSSPDSDSIKFNFNAEGYQSDTIQHYFDTKGYGFSFDFEHNFTYQNKQNKSQVINLKLSNFGVIFWNNQTTHTYVDSANTYSGFEVMNLLNRDTTSGPLIEADTLGILSQKSSRAEMLPFEISIQKLANRFTDQKLQLTYGFKALISSDYRPYGFLGVYYAPINSLGISSRLAYGGFGGLTLGLTANYFVQDKFQIQLGTYNLIGFVSPKYGFGKSLNLSMHYKF